MISEAQLGLVRRATHVLCTSAPSLRQKLGYRAVVMGDAVASQDLGLTVQDHAEGLGYRSCWKNGVRGMGDMTRRRAAHHLLAGKTGPRLLGGHKHWMPDETTWGHLRRKGGMTAKVWELPKYKLGL